MTERTKEELIEEILECGRLLDDMYVPTKKRLYWSPNLNRVINSDSGKPMEDK